MATFDEFYESLPEDSNKRGEYFEKVFVPWFLKTDPEWSTQVKEVWLWDDYPHRWGKDCGIDLVYEDRQGKHWAVQSKCVSPEREISKAEIDSFLSESSDPRIHGRLLIASTDGIGKNAQQVIDRQEKQVVCFLLEHFRHSEVEFPSSPDDLSTGQRKEKRTPRPHQQEAIKNVVEGFQKEDRGQLLMACGTGKTLTSLWIKEALDAKRTLVLVPSLGLLSQTLREWTATSQKQFNWICVCSDKSVAKTEKTKDHWFEHISELGVPVTSEPKEIRSFLLDNAEGIVFSTYQSSQLVAEAQESLNASEFDIAFADEAHRCAGKVSPAFGCILDSQKIRAKKRLFMTATPRILSNRIKSKAKAEDIEVASMDDENQFGNVLHRLNFSEAIDRNLLTDYRVVVMGVDDPRIQEQIEKRSLSSTGTGVETNFEVLANHISIAKCIRNYKLQRLITFHGRVRGARDFSEMHQNIINWLHPSCKTEKKTMTGYISGEMSSLERNKKISQLRNISEDEVGILSNARCLSEGVDVPTLDGIAFIEPRSSQVDIIQAIGRAIRKSESKSYGYIILPVYLGDTGSIDEEILMSRFQHVWEIILALRSQDDSLAEAIDRIRIEIGNRGKAKTQESVLNKLVFDLPERIHNAIGESLQTILVQRTSEDWFEMYGRLMANVIVHGSANLPASTPEIGEWICTQRKQYKRNRLAKNQIRLLQDLPGWTWDPIAGKWEEMYAQTRRYAENDDLNLLPTNHKFYSWVGGQRQRYKKGELSDYQIKKLLEISGWSWDPREDEWIKIYHQVKNMYASSLESNEEDKKEFGQWINWQRMKYRQGALKPERIRMLELITNWDWNPETTKWEENLKLLDKNLADFDLRIDEWSESKRIYNWLKIQVKKQKGDDLEKDKFEKLEHTMSSIRQLLEGKKENVDQRIQCLLDSKKQKSITEILRDELMILEGHMGDLRNTYGDGWKHYAVIEATTSGSNIYESLKHCKRLSKKEEIPTDIFSDEHSCWEIVTNIKAFIWRSFFEQLVIFWNKNEHLRLPEKDKLTYWAVRQRALYMRNQLDDWKIRELEALDYWHWDPQDSKWFIQFNTLKSILGSGKSNDMPAKTKTWIVNQRRKRESLSQSQIKLLESLPGWDWDPKETAWRKMYSDLCDYIKDNKTIKIEGTSTLTYWVIRQRQSYKKGTLSIERKKLLEELDGWTWNHQRA